MANVSTCVFQCSSSTGDDTFTALVNTENKMDLLREKNITQRKITDYFKK